MVRVTLVLLCCAAFALRVVPRWDLVYAHDVPLFADPDAYHHLRQVEQWVRHFPERMRFDPYMLHPGGQDVPVAPLFDGIAATVAWLLGLGSPSEATVARVLGVLPAVFGALTCLPAFALGRRLGGTAGGLVAALAVAAAPGQLLVRSMLGFSDHHALETLLGATSLACLAAALGDGPVRGAAAARWAGLAVALQLLAWTGAAMTVAALAAGTLAAAVADVLRRRESAEPVAAFAFGCAAVAVPVVALCPGDPPGRGLAVAALGGAAVALLVAFAVGASLVRAGVRPWLAAIAMPAALGVIGATAATLSRTVADTTLAAVGWLAPTASRVTVGEARPLPLGDDGAWSLGPVWREFGLAGPLAIAGLVVLALRLRRGARRDDALLWVVCAGALALPFAQTRFAANAAVAAAALAGGVLGPWLGRMWRGGTADTPAWLGRGVWPAATVLAIALPTAPVAIGTLGTPGLPAEPWREVLSALRAQTPEPFGDAAAFERLVDRPRDGAKGPVAGYGVLAWWDAGYWITQIARRVPLANPTQAGAGDVARVLLETDPARAAAEADRLGARYLVLDSELPVMPRGRSFAGRLPSVAPWAGRDETTLVRRLREVQPDGTYADVVLYLPDYFRSLAVRLHSFDGKETPASGIVAVSWRPGADGIPVAEEAQSCATNAEADAWVAARPAGTACVASLSPFDPCVPLEAAPQFRRVLQSSTAIARIHPVPIWHVQVWERVSE